MVALRAYFAIEIASPVVVTETPFIQETTQGEIQPPAKPISKKANILYINLIPTSISLLYFNDAAVKSLRNYDCYLQKLIHRCTIEARHSSKMYGVMPHSQVPSYKPPFVVLRQPVPLLR